MISKQQQPLIWDLTIYIAMASVSSLDQDMRKLRLDRYTPQAANEIRTWIEQTLGEKLQAGDLLESLKDGVALCKYGCTRDSCDPTQLIIAQTSEPSASTAGYQV